MQNCCLLLLLLHFSPLTQYPVPFIWQHPRTELLWGLRFGLGLGLQKSSVSLSLFSCPPWLGYVLRRNRNWESEAVHQQRIQMRGNCAGLALKSLGKGYLQNFKCEKNCKYTSVCVQCCCCLFVGGKKLNSHKSICKSYVHTYQGCQLPLTNKKGLTSMK